MNLVPLARRHLGRLTLVSIGMSATAGCGLVRPAPEPELPVDVSGEFTDFLAAERSRGDAAPLADAVDFAWDDVQYFPYGTPAAEINDFAKKVVITREFNNREGHLFVFRRDGHGTAAIGTYLEILDLDGYGAVFSSRVLVMRETGRAVIFIEPAG